MMLCRFADQALCWNHRSGSGLCDKTGGQRGLSSHYAQGNRRIDLNTIRIQIKFIKITAILSDVLWTAFCALPFHPKALLRKRTAARDYAT